MTRGDDTLVMTPSDDTDEVLSGPRCSLRSVLVLRARMAGLNDR